MRPRRPVSPERLSSGGRGFPLWVRRFMLILGLLLVSGGLAMLPATRWWHRHFEPTFEVVEVKNQVTPEDLGFSSHFPAERLTRYRLGKAQDLDIPLSVIDYRNEENQLEKVTVYPETKPATAVRSANPRMSLWSKVAEAISKHASPDALYITWWDNAQRIHFLTGEATWPRRPAAESFAGLPLAAFWQEAAGGLAVDTAPVRQLAQWLTMDADLALQAIRSDPNLSRMPYLLACVDDLARLGEIERLSGVSIPLEVRYFPSGEDLHGQIKEVRRWASETGSGANYLVQPVVGGGVRAWRVTRPEGSNLLLIRLLPFSKSLESPLEGLRLVYQSHWGAYISLYEVISGAH